MLSQNRFATIKLGKYTPWTASTNNAMVFYLFLFSSQMKIKIYAQKALTFTFVLALCSFISICSSLEFIFAQFDIVSFRLFHSLSAEVGAKIDYSWKTKLRVAQLSIRNAMQMWVRQAKRVKIETSRKWRRRVGKKKKNAKTYEKITRGEHFKSDL